jgi:hypothetical protein
MDFREAFITVLRNGRSTTLGLDEEAAQVAAREAHAELQADERAEEDEAARARVRAAVMDNVEAHLRAAVDFKGAGDWRDLLVHLLVRDIAWAEIIEEVIDVDAVVQKGFDVGPQRLDLED